MKYLKVLYVQVIIGIVAGVLVGWLFPAFAPVAKLISEMFINMIRMVIAPVIFFTIVLGIAGAGDLKKIGRVGGKGLLYFEIVTTLAIIIGLVVANVIKPGVGVAQSAVAGAPAFKGDTKGFDWAEFILHIVPSNIVDAFAKGDIIQILFFGILFSVGLKHLGSYGESVITTFEKLNKVLFNVLKIVMKVSPFGAFGGMAYTIGKFGFTSLALLGKLMLTFYITSLLFIFVILNLIARYYGFSLWKLLGYIKAELLIVLGSSSSESVLPNIIAKLEKAGCARSVVGLIVPAGYSFNLDGTSIYLSLSVIFLAQVYNVPLSLAQELSIIGILLITSKGAAGITGSGFLVLASTLTALKVVPVEGLALLIGVDRFMSEARALTNMIGNTVATVVIARSEKAVDMVQYRAVVENRARIPKVS
ncbi:C4-dicarboxylate transporter DctA [Segetibacter sp.]|jgi:aerobic C4-dicarboxylate transport protein|uniref:C4-dicarboxylate transporter DctA n=1 Tax=Segetibacter sp. TaxID=2231182 RepID=UPI0026100F02|nr:C4-dicarboxylate transporter DctA [Segetibacter sp.]MCW3078912.1 Aerobic C4-dicarboxylate transporter for fumarate, L-malate, D-malate, succunate [Segetibacter sp.]